MNTKEIIEKLQSLDADNISSFDDLANEIIHRAREETKRIVRIWIEDEEELMEEASVLLSKLGTVALFPLIDAGFAPMEIQRAHQMDMIVKAQIETRERIVSFLVPLLEDQEKIVEDTPESVMEGDPPIKRVCDEAYIQLRKLLNTTETEDSYLLNESIYLQLDFEERDEEIMAAKISGTWDRWLDESDEEED